MTTSGSGSVVLAGGGTAGHTSPLIATGLELRSLGDGVTVTALGTARANEAVEITSSGWQVVDTTPVKFRRAKGMLPLPVPVPGGNLAALRPFVNLASDDDWRLVVSWLLATFRPTGPYPVLVVYGEQTWNEMMGGLIDVAFEPNMPNPELFEAVPEKPQPASGPSAVVR